MMMNRGMSTSAQVAMHISTSVQKHAALAIVTPLTTKSYTIFSPSNPDEGRVNKGPKPIDMNQVLSENCTLQLLTFAMSRGVDDYSYDVLHAAYWRTCSLILMETAAKVFDEFVNV